MVSPWLGEFATVSDTLTIAFTLASRDLAMRILLVTSMVPDPDGIGAMPKLFSAQLTGLLARHDVTLLSSFGEDRGQAEAAEALLASGLDAHFVDRRRSSSATALAGPWRARGAVGRAGAGPGGSSAERPACSRWSTSLAHERRPST